MKTKPYSNKLDPGMISIICTLPKKSCSRIVDPALPQPVMLRPSSTAKLKRARPLSTQARYAWTVLNRKKHEPVRPRQDSF